MPAACVAHDGREWSTRTDRTWGPDSIFGPFILDDTFRGLLTLTVPSTLAPVRLMLAEISSPRGFDTRRKTVGYIVRGLLDGPLANRRTS